MMLASSFGVLLAIIVHCATACTDTVYVVTGDNCGLAISRDGGETWATVLTLTNNIWSVSAHGDNVFVGANDGLYVSHDNGASWSIRNLQTNSSYHSTVKSVFVDDDNDNRVYALIGYTGCGRVAVSSDNGDTWPINFPLPGPPFSAYPLSTFYIDGPRIYVASYGGLGYTDDLGATWTFKDQSSGLGANNVMCVIGRGQTIYAGLFDQVGAPVSMSRDDGITWKTVNTTGNSYYVYSMYLQNNTLYVATYGGGLSWSNDFTTWTRKTTADGLASNSAYSITGSGNNLYLGTLSGLSISRDNGRTWITKTTKDGLPSNNMFSVFVQCV